MRRLFTACMAMVFCGLGLAEQLPIYMEESHAGSFYHFVETLPIDEPHTLILFDAHSDSNGIAGSDKIRAAIRRGPTPEKRSQMLKTWREEGRIQSFNWIEPLMPAPITEVVWVPSVALGLEEAAELEAEAREALDAHEEAFPRESGSFGQRFKVRSLEQLEADVRGWSESRRVIASVDLDFFARVADEEAAGAMERVLAVVLPMRGLTNLSFAVSSPYLRNAAQAEMLVRLALDAAWRVANADVCFDPFAKTGPDRSLMARLLERQGKRLPYLNLEGSGPALSTLLLAHWGTDSKLLDQRASVLLRDWAGSPFVPRIEIRQRLRRPDGTWAVEAGDARVALSLTPPPIGAEVRWFALQAPDHSYRVSDADLGFAVSAPRWLWWKRVLLKEGFAQEKLPLSVLMPLLDVTHHCGTVHLFAEVERDGEVWRTQTETICVRAAGTSGARAVWSEQFGLPYVFDSRLLMGRHATGPDTRWGADCAAFITAGLRAEGWLLPWGSPKELRAFTQPWSEDRLPQEEPVLLDFGSHVGALWEDKPPVGRLDAEDLCVHQLENTPEIIPFQRLAAGRGPLQMRVLKKTASEVQLLFAGDVMLGRKVGDLIHRGEDPLAKVRLRLAYADLTVGNLECVVAPTVADRVPGRFCLRAPERAIQVLQRAGFDAMSVANNHALDLGEPGLAETQARLAAGGIIPLSRETVTFKIGGMKVSLVAWDDSQQLPADQLLHTVGAARPEADYLVVLPHWGEEHQRIPTGRQRELAASLLQSGADLVVGSGPHVVQPLEHYPTGTVAFSLGNAVFDGPGPDLEWSRGALLEIILDAHTMRPVRMRHLWLNLDSDGRVDISMGE